MDYRQMLLLRHPQLQVGGGLQLRHPPREVDGAAPVLLEVDGVQLLLLLVVRKEEALVGEVPVGLRAGVLAQARLVVPQADGEAPVEQRAGGTYKSILH